MLLAGLLLLLISVPLVQEFPDAGPIEAALTTLVLLSAALAAGGRRKTLALAAVLIAPAIAGKWIDHYWRGVLPPAFTPIAAMVPIAFTILILFRFILRARRVNSEVICAAVSNYLLMGFLWAFAYAIVAQLAPGSFAISAPAASADVSSMVKFTPVYFSFVTLCTVGYGDIAPVSTPARLLALLEAMAGAFYMAILVARLVAVYSHEQVSDAPGK
jgi:hypothetical protein